MTTWVRKRLHFAQTMEDFRVALQRFLDTGTRTHEKMRKAIILDQQRDWKTHLEFLGVHMKGHTGRAAPRVFEFRQRRGLPDSHPMRQQGSATDVILRCKQYMSDAAFQQSLVLLTSQQLDSLPAALPTGMLPRLVKTKKYRNMIERHAEMIEQSPFNMRDAARELRSWVNETRPELPPLDVRHVAMFPHLRRLHDPPRPLQVVALDDNDAAAPEALPLEISMTPVTLGKKRVRASTPKASAKAARSQASALRKARDDEKAAKAVEEAEFKTNLISFLTKHQNLSASDASTVAAEAFKRRQNKSLKTRRAAPHSLDDNDDGNDNSDGEPGVLDLEAF
ncbi:unnamed protein product [Symbiodinium necroappetens]|uniref:Uncharacterized protein n=1 Tax=Symbiodinium necroappetens TaxID=1628268 RepID=A0A812N6X6_9DINO|nr:unnamed protein product [Symbiodinium necroappetens]